MKVALVLLVVLLTACSSNPKPAVEKGPEVTVAFRQLPHEPVYNRLRWVQLPSVVPSRPRNDSAPLILPVMHFSLDDGTLYEAASMLAASSHYSSYCSSLISNRKISIEKVGTIDEIAAHIAKIAHIHAIVDHNNKEVRFTAVKTVSSSSYNRKSMVHSKVKKKVSGYEYRSNNKAPSL